MLAFFSALSRSLIALRLSISLVMRPISLSAMLNAVHAAESLVLVSFFQASQDTIMMASSIARRSFAVISRNGMDSCVFIAIVFLKRTSLNPSMLVSKSFCPYPARLLWETQVSPSSFSTSNLLVPFGDMLRVTRYDSITPATFSQSNSSMTRSVPSTFLLFLSSLLLPPRYDVPNMAKLIASTRVDFPLPLSAVIHTSPLGKVNSFTLFP